jgi:hypothetical protein
MSMILSGIHVWQNTAPVRRNSNVVTFDDVRAAFLDLPRPPRP